MSKRASTVLPPDREEKVLGIFVRDVSFYRTFFPLLLVIVLQQLAALAVNLADNIMLGRYSELALSGASLVNQLQFTLQQIAAGIGMGIVVLAAQYWGQKRHGAHQEDHLPGGQVRLCQRRPLFCHLSAGSGGSCWGCSPDDHGRHRRRQCAI